MKQVRQFLTLVSVAVAAGCGDAAPAPTQPNARLRLVLPADSLEMGVRSEVVFSPRIVDGRGVVIDSAPRPSFALGDSSVVTVGPEPRGFPVFVLTGLKFGRTTLIGVAMRDGQLLADTMVVTVNSILVSR
jgi:hypothetical protein